MKSDNDEHANIDYLEKISLFTKQRKVVYYERYLMLLSSVTYIFSISKASTTHIFSISKAFSANYIEHQYETQHP